LRQLTYAIFILLVGTLCLQAAPLQKVTLQLQWKHQFEFAGFYAAKEKGFYEEVGLDVKLREFDGKQNIIQDVASGKYTYGIGYSSLVYDYIQGAPIALLGSFLKQSPLALVTQSEIISLRDLKGKKVMGISSSKNQTVLLSMLNGFGITLENITPVPFSFSVDEFVKGDVDALVVYTTNEPFAINQKNKQYNIFKPSYYGYEFNGLNLFTSSHELQTHPERAKKFTEASIKGWQYAINNRSEIIELIQQKYNTQNKSYDALAFEADNIVNLMMPSLYPVGSIDEKKIEYIVSHFINAGLLEKDSDINLHNFLSFHDYDDFVFSDAEIDYMHRKKEVSYCVDPDWMPYEMIKNGKHIGMSKDYFELFQKQSELTFKLIPTTSWNQSIEFAKERKCDLFSLAMRTPERSKYMNFTDSYLNFPIVITTKPDELFISDIESIIEKPLGIVKGYAYGEILRFKYPKVNLIEVNSLKEGLQMVANGELFGFIDSLTTVGYAIQKSFPGELKITGKFDDTWDLAVGVRDDDLTLLAIMQKLVSSIKQDEHQRILNKWLSIEYSKDVDYTLVKKILLILFVLLVVFIYLYTKKNQYIKRILEAKAQVEDSQEKFQKLFNQQRSLIVITTGHKLIMANNAVYEFFGYTSLTELMENCQDISEKFVNVNGYFNQELIPKESNWITQIEPLIGDRRIVAMHDKEDVPHAFNVSISSFDHQSYIVTFTDISATITEKIQLQTKVIKDKLTGALNREFYQQNIKNIIDSVEANHFLGIALIDIDHFKNINDTYGHDVGDTILIEFTALIKKSIRGDDFFIRWGGEEFMLLMTISSYDSFVKILEQLRKNNRRE
jgi:ABC-type nitrate/sulfonate/bicarbonate transport system substrate-binding protein/GGDEF domain-containing protein/ABC-type amino acid transport substrate-binding protein